MTLTATVEGGDGESRGELGRGKNAHEGEGDAGERRKGLAGLKV